jgi:ribonuclease P protein component
MRGTPPARSRAGRGRLSRSADFDRVFRSGRSHACREFVLYVFPRAEQAPARLGLSVSRKVGGAVERNRVKRLLREAFSAEGQRLPEGMDAVVVARRDAHALAQGEGLSGVQRVLSELLDRAVGAREDDASRGAGTARDGIPAGTTRASAGQDSAPGSSS